MTPVKITSDDLNDAAEKLVELSGQGDHFESLVKIDSMRDDAEVSSISFHVIPYCPESSYTTPYLFTNPP